MRIIMKSFLSKEEGATAIEYGLIAALVAVAIIGALTALGTDVTGVFNSISTEVENATPAEAVEEPTIVRGGGDNRIGGPVRPR